VNTIIEKHNEELIWNKRNILRNRNWSRIEIRHEKWKL